MLIIASGPLLVFIVAFAASKWVMSKVVTKRVAKAGLLEDRVKTE